MLGQLLEISLAARPIATSFEFYRALGFRSLPVGDLSNEPAAALYDGAIALGLHDGEEPTPTLTFVRPQLQDYVRALKRLGVALEQTHLADDEFNRIDFLDPNGQPIRLLEARTFAPGDWDERNVSACGEFLEYSVATDSIERSRAFWEPFGLAPIAAGEAPHAWLRLAGHGLVLGLHEAHFGPGLSFRAPNVAARAEYLKAKGLRIKTGAALADRGRPAATLLAPEGTALYLLEGD